MCEFCLLREEEDEGGAAAPKAPHGAHSRHSRNYSGAFRKTPDRLFGMGLIRLYQLTLSGFVGNFPEVSVYRDIKLPDIMTAEI